MKKYVCPIILLLFVTNTLLLANESNNSLGDSSSFKKKHVSTAMWITISATAVPAFIGISFANNYVKPGYDAWISLAGAGLVLGPAMGKLYAQDYGSAMTGILVRSIAGSLAVYGGNRISVFSNKNDGAGFLLITGSLVGAYSLFHSIFTTPRSVRAYNTKHTLSLTPAYDQKHKRVSIFVGVTY